MTKTLKVPRGGRKPVTRWVKPVTVEPVPEIGMILFLTHANLAAPRVLSVKTVPKRFLSLGRLVHPKGVTSALFWRTVFEMPVARYALALSPFPIALIFRPEWALPISLAPVPMALFVLMLESYVLSIPSPSARRALVDSNVSDQMLDLLKARANDVLTSIAARQEPGVGALHLVIEQSGLLRIPPLTYVSVQQDGDTPRFIELTAEDQSAIAAGLFDADLDERALRLVNVSRNEMLRHYTVDPNSISAHARLAALAETKTKSTV